MDVVKKIATEFADHADYHAHSLENFDSELNSRLIYINKSSEKLRFLSYLRDVVETKYQEHARVCRDPETCHKNESFEIALYSINQQYDQYYSIEGNSVDYERPAMQFFSDGQYFDAFTAIKECLKQAKQSIVLIDGYIDNNTLDFFPGKEPSVPLRILTKARSVDNSLERAIDLYNKQYENLKIKTSENYHDRFLIIDDKYFYHIGASIKDAGKKAFMFSRIEDEDIMQLIRKKLLIEWPDYI